MTPAEAPVQREPLDLSELVRARPTGEPGRFTLDVPDGLQQGRGAWGGVATGAMTSAALQVVPSPEQAVRTMSAQLVAPLLVGRAQLRAELLRRGSATTTVAVRLLDAEGQLVAHGVVVLGAPRVGADMPGGPDWLGVELPAALAAGADAVPVTPVGPPLAPDFLTQVELRAIAGLPYSGTTGLEASGWLRPHGPVARVDAPLLVALADTWWIAVMARLRWPRPAATVGFACEVAGDPAVVPVAADGRLEPLFHRGRLVAAREGFAVETRELWTATGELLTWNTQTVAVIR